MHHLTPKFNDSRNRGFRAEADVPARRIALHRSLTYLVQSYNLQVYETAGFIKKRSIVAQMMLFPLRHYRRFHHNPYMSSSSPSFLGSTSTVPRSSISMHPGKSCHQGEKHRKYSGRS
jgi:hypothetical protein